MHVNGIFELLQISKTISVSQLGQYERLIRKMYEFIFGEIFGKDGKNIEKPPAGYSI